MKAYTQSPDNDTLKRWFDMGIELWVTDKFDGIRCLTTNEGAMSRSMKPIPNRHVQLFMATRVPVGWDGELMTGSIFGDCQSHFMSHDVVGDFTYHVFDDYTHAYLPYSERVERLKRFALMNPSMPQVKFELPRVVRDFATLQKEENEAVEDRGREGLILRVPWQVYKYGRSTLAEAGMLKLKRWEDAEATVVSFEPLMRNTNAPEQDAFGRQKRGHGISGKVPDEMLGAFIVYSEEFGTFNIGGPFTQLQRCKFWEDRHNLVGKQVTYKFQRHGTKEKPRSPRFHRIRLD